MSLPLSRSTAISAASSASRLDGLVDGRGLVTGDDPLETRELGVLAGQRDAVDAGALEGGGDAAGHAVVGGVDAVDVSLPSSVMAARHLLRGDGVRSTVRICS